MRHTHISTVVIFSIVTSSKRGFRTAAERQRDAATGVPELVCSRYSPVSH